MDAEIEESSYLQGGAASFPLLSRRIFPFAARSKRAVRMVPVAVAASRSPRQVSQLSKSVLMSQLFGVRLSVPRSFLARARALQNSRTGLSK